VNGLLVPPGSVKDLSARLKQLLMNKPQRLQMGLNARERFMQKYTLTNFYDRLTNIFEQVLHGKGQK